MTTGTLRIRRQPLSDEQLHNEYRRIRTQNPIISAAAAITIATRHQAAAPGTQLAAFAAGSPVDAGDLLQEVLATYLTVTRTEDQHELLALALWTAKHSTGHTDPPETSGHEARLDSHHQRRGHLPGPA
ncbi:MAG TPA: hypothetical protein VGL36_35550 [Kribbella sp.]